MTVLKGNEPQVGIRRLVYVNVFSSIEEDRFRLTSLVMFVYLDIFIILSNGTQVFDYNIGTRRSDKMRLLLYNYTYIHFYFPIT